jgi:hypothetical protein
MAIKAELFDGTILEFPDGTDPSVIQNTAKRLTQERQAAAEPEPTKDTGIFSMAGRALARGAKQTGSLIGDVLPAMAASAVGADEYAARQMAEAAQTQKEIEQKYGARYKSLEDVKGPGDYIPFALETALEQVPGMATALIPGAGFGVAGGRMAAAAAAKKAAERGAAEAAAAKYGAQAAATGAMRGQIGGAFLGSYALNAPEVFQNIFEETGGQMEPAAAALAGSVSAALDSILPVAILKQMGPNVKAGVVENLLEKSGMPSPLARKVVGAAVTGASTEGLTEGAQEAISIAAEKFVQENPEVWGSKEFNRLIESSVRGAVGGGAFGAAGAGAGAYLEGRRRRLEERQLEADRKETVAADLATQLGRDPTEEEVDNFMAAMKKARETKEVQDEGGTTDTGTGKPSISVPSEEGLGKGPTDTGTAELTEADLDRINRLAADAGVREEDVYDQLKKDVEQRVAEVVLTPDAEALLKSVEAGGTPAMMTNNLKRIAKENGVKVTSKDTPNSVIDKLKALKTAPEEVVEPEVTEEVTEEAKPQYTPEQLAEIERRQKHSKDTLKLLEKEASPRINAVDYVQKVEAGEIKPNAIKLKGFINALGLDVPAGKDYVERAFNKLKADLDAMETIDPLSRVLEVIEITKDQAGVKDFNVGDTVRVGNMPGTIVGVEGDYVKFRPDNAVNAKAYQRVQKKNVEFVARPEKGLPASASKKAEQFGEEAGKLTVDMPDIVQLFGAGMYGSNLVEVTIKELLQNAFDAVKGAVSSKKEKALYKTGHITIELDSRDRTIKITDDARGMTPDIVKNALFTIAGSDKSDLDPEDRSGGLGVAKLGFMVGTEKFKVDTVRNGVRTTVDTTGPNIARSNFTIKKTPAPKNEHGTTIEVKIPEFYFDTKSQSKKQIYFWTDPDAIETLKHPLIGPVEVTLKNRGYAGDIETEVLPVGVNFDEKATPFLTKAKFDWGSADIYFGVNRTDDPKHQVLSSGVYQFQGSGRFDSYFRINKERIPYDIIVNIKSSVDAKDTDYPFENNRESFKPRIEEDVKSLEAFLARVARGEEAKDLKESFEGVVSMPRIEAGQEIADASKKLRKAFDQRGQAQKETVVPELPKEIVIKDNIVSDKQGRIIYDRVKEEEKKKESTFKAEKEAPTKEQFMIDLKQDPKLPIFHNNTNVDLIEVGKKYGDPEKFFAELGTLLVEMKEAVSKSNLYGYETLSPDNLFFGGISIDRGYGGVHIKVPYKAVLINPFYEWGAKTLFGVRQNLLNTMIHEIAHTGSMDHGVGHNSEMMRVEQYLADEGLLDYYRDALLDVLSRHESTFAAMKEEYGKSTTKNIAKSLEDINRAKSARRDVSGGEDQIDELRARAGRGRGEPVSAYSADAGRGAEQLKSPPFAPLTEEASKFFAKSKVVDANGRLIPLLHGTNATGPKGEGLTQIKLSKEGSLGAGIYLTPIPLIANNYTGIPTPEAIDALEAEGRTPKEIVDKLRAIYKTGELAPGQVGGNVIPVFADIENPLIINTKDNRFDPAVDLLVALDVPRDKAEAIVEKANEDKGGITKEVITRARAKGYDGIFQYRDDELAEVVAFSPSQVKSVFNKDPSRLPELLNAFNRDENTSPKADQVPLNDPLFSTAHPTVTTAIANNDVQGALKALKNTAGKFLSGLADRLMQLNLDTVVGFDDLHYDMSIKSLDRVKGQKTRILNWLQQVKPAIYASRFDESKMKMPVTETLKAFEDFRDGKLGIDPKMFKEDLEDVIKVYSNAVTSLNAPGTYFMDDNAIGLSLTRGGNSNYAIAHEFTHAATHWAIDHPNELNPKQRQALANLHRLFRYAKKHTKNPDAYGYNNLHEFVAEAFSRPSFQNELRQMQKVMDTSMSAWSKFIQLVAQLFGVDNVLFHTLANADVLFSANSGSATNKGPGLLWAPSRYSVRNGTFKLNPGERMGFIDKAVQLRESWKNTDKSNLKKFFGSLNNQYRRYLLGAFTVDQLADMYGTDMPQLKAYAKEVDAMIATRNAILKEGAPIIGRWSNLLQDNPEKAEQLGKVMIESTLEKMDPSILDPQLKQLLTKKGMPDLLARYDNSTLKDAWREMSSGKDGDVAVEIYKQVRNFYERRMNEYIQVQEARIREAGLAKNLPPDEIDAKIRAFKQDIEESIIRPYFPIKRFGDYFLMVGRGKNKIFMQFEDAFARDAELEKQRARLLKTQIKDKDTGETRTYTEEEAAAELWPGQGFNEVLNQKLNEVTQLNKIKALVDETTEDILKSTDPQIMQDRVAAMQDQLKDAFGQYYLELLPSESIKKMFLHRQNVAGPSQDMLRAFSLSYERIAYQRARFQHMPKLFNIVEAAKMRSANMPTTEEKATYGDVANELAKQFKSGVLEPPKHSKLTTFLTHFGFLNFLTSPASAVVNMMAIPGLYIPVAGARYGGSKRVGTVISKYVRMLGGTGYINEETNRYEFLSLARANLQSLNDVNTKDGTSKINLPKGKTLADVYTAGVNRNVIDTTLVHDSVSIGERPAEEYTGRWQKFMYYASLPFHAAEKFNREIAYMTSFELAYENNITNKKMTPEAAFDAALDQARDLTQETMFNYNTTNKPRYFRGNIANVLLQFKMYPQHMCVLMFRTFQKGWADGEKAELDKIRKQLEKAPEDVLNKALADKRAEMAEVKKEARDAFYGMMGMSFLTAGMTGMPLWFIFSGVASAFHAVFGDDDEPFDPDNWFKNWANRTFGGFAGDTISRGLLSQVTGMNFADRMNLNLPDMWFPDVRKSQSEVDYVQNMFINTLGPSLGALLVSYPEALKRFNDGHTERAVEALMPAGIKNVMVGTRYMVEGQALTLKGNTLVEDISAREALSQMLGFSPERVAQKQQAAFATKNANETIMNRRTDLLNAFFIAIDTGDADMMAKVIEKMVVFSQTNPGVAIDPDKLVDSVQKRYQDRALANITGGMGLNKNLIPQLMPMLEYGER